MCKNPVVTTTWCDPSSWFSILQLIRPFFLFLCLCVSSRLVLSQVSIYEGDKRDCRKFCTTGIDGAMTIWDFKVRMHTNRRTHRRPDLSPLTLSLSCASTSSESRSFYPGSPHHVKKSRKWMKKRSRPHFSPSLPPPLSSSPPSSLLQRSQ